MQLFFPGWSWTNVDGAVNLRPGPSKCARTTPLLETIRVYDPVVNLCLSSFCLLQAGNVHFYDYVVIVMH